jgi:ribosomal-protein-alanine N-acetyltransferase
MDDMYAVELHGEQVRLREFRMDDVDAALAVVGADRVTRWLSFDSRTREQTSAMLLGAIERARLTPRNEYYLAATEPASDRVIGFVRLGLGGVQAAKLGYAIRADHWGHGYATDAARVIIEYGFRDLRLHRITAAMGPDNEASIAVVKKFGFC